MFPFWDSISTVMKAGYGAQLAAMTELTGTAVKGMEKAINLNLSTIKASLEASANSSQQMMSATTPQEWLLLRSAQVQPGVEKAFHYSHHMADIVSCTQAEIARVAAVHVANASSKIKAA
jgi:phasin family protein